MQTDSIITVVFTVVWTIDITMNNIDMMIIDHHAFQFPRKLYQLITFFVMLEIWCKSLLSGKILFMRLFTFLSATPRVALHNVPNGQSSISKIPLQSRGKVLGPKSPNFQHFPTFQNAAVCIGLSVYSVLVISSKLKDLLDSPDQFADFTSLADLTKQNNNAIAVCVFFSWIKLFKYISFNKTMTQLSSTLSRVSKYFLPYFWALFKSLYCLTFLTASSEASRS